MASCVALGRGRGEIPFYFCAFIEGVIAGVLGCSSANPIPDFPTLLPTYSILNMVMVRLFGERIGWCITESNNY